MAAKAKHLLITKPLKPLMASICRWSAARQGLAGELTRFRNPVFYSIPTVNADESKKTFLKKHVGQSMRTRLSAVPAAELSNSLNKAERE
jgi:hypothetical protein